MRSKLIGCRLYLSTGNFREKKHTLLNISEHKYITQCNINSSPCCSELSYFNGYMLDPGGFFLSGYDAVLVRIIIVHGMF